MEPQSPPENPISLGRVVAAHGIRGWLKIRGDAGALAAIGEVERIWLESKGRWTVWQVQETLARGGTWLLALRGVESRTDAEGLLGSTVALPRDAMPAPADGEYYWADLIGLDVVDQVGVRLGSVQALIDTPANCVMRVKGVEEILIPFVASYVSEVDLRLGRITVQWSS